MENRPSADARDTRLMRSGVSEEKLVNDEDADACLTLKYRPPYVICQTRFNLLAGNSGVTAEAQRPQR